MTDIPTPVADTLPGLLGHWAAHQPDRIWLTETNGDVTRDWSWAQAQAEVSAMATHLEQTLPGTQRKVAILSRNRAHWMLADLAVMAAGHVTVPVFTTQTPDITRYILDFAGVEVLYLGQSENWDTIRPILPDGLRVIRFPGAPACDGAADWDAIVAAHRGQAPGHEPQPRDLATIVFTSGTTGMPKGVMHSHHSLMGPMLRASPALQMELFDRFLSYLPLSHLAEREQIETMGLIWCCTVTFLEDRTKMLRDLTASRPTFFFGAPRVWEQFQHAVFQLFGGRRDYESARAADPDAATGKARAFLGLDHAKVLLSASAPISRALLAFYDQIGLTVIEGFGQTEAMGLTINTREDMRLGSIGKPTPGVETRISDQGELQVRIPDCAMGYYNDPERTAETFVGGWVMTGDRARIDADGFHFITGRIKDYFKTIHGKFVAPVPIEDDFARIPQLDHRCLLGRGMSRTVLVVTRKPGGVMPREELETVLRDHAAAANEGLEHHARIGAVIVADGEWTTDNGFLTTTLKMKRDSVADAYEAMADELARQAAETGTIIVRSL